MKLFRKLSVVSALVFYSGFSYANDNIAKIEINEFTEQVLCLAANVYNEARSESLDSMIAVAEVTVNRSKSLMFPSTVCEVIYQPNQFSWTSRTVGNDTPCHLQPEGVFIAVAKNFGDMVAPMCGKQVYLMGKLFPKSHDFASWMIAVDVAHGVISGTMKSNFESALFYHRKDITTKWSAKLKPLGELDNHKFFSMEVIKDVD